MDVDKRIGRRLADKSAVGAINRPLRVYRPRSRSPGYFVKTQWRLYGLQNHAKLNGLPAIAAGVYDNQSLFETHQQHVR
jgi:hypothetical protein